MKNLTMAASTQRQPWKQKPPRQRERNWRGARGSDKIPTRQAKHDILSEFIAISGYHPKYAIEVLNREESGPRPPQRRSRERLYDV